MFLLGASTTPQVDLLISLGMIAAVIGAAVYIVRRREASLRRNRQIHEQSAVTHRDRESSAFQQHTELNSLAAQKFKREVELLDIQLQLAKFDLGMRHDHRDYHDLVMEKARLEIESLKLHIKEQQKRNDDFGSSDDH
jgi:cell division protein FtsL